MFIREKIIYNKPYAYLVKTRWDKRSKKVKQKVHKYLGKIYKLEKVRNILFEEYFSFELETYVEETDLKDILYNLIEVELFRHGFEKSEKGDLMVLGDISIPLSPKDIEKVYQMNEGYLNKYTLKEIMRYYTLLDESINNVPFRFAALFVNAGINIDKDLFIQLYQKLFSDNIDSKHSA
ncbi:MAG: hypothetical protein ACOCUR_01335 [Nanoarchaeota archaeon]